MQVQTVERPGGESSVATMNAVCIHRHGGPEVLSYEEVPCPEPGPGEVLVRVRAAGVNPLDWKFRNGYVKDLVLLPFPAIPGWDFSGVVAAVGSCVDSLRPGDEVFGMSELSHGGAYAEYIAVQDSECALKPRSIDHIRAAAIPVSALTAWQALFDVAELAPGQRALIHGASGGVGSFASQLAKWRGAYVIGTASKTHHDFLRQLGVDEAIDYHTPRFEEKLRDIDVVLDTAGWRTQQRSWKTLKPGGILVSVVALPSAAQAWAHRVRSELVFVQPDTVELGKIARLVDSGKIQSFVQTVIPLSEAGVAQELSQALHTRGKIVLLAE